MRSRRTSYRGITAILLAGIIGLAGAATNVAFARPGPWDQPILQLAQLRLNHQDILGRWCSQTGVYVIDRNRLLMIRHADGHKSQLPIRYFTFGLNRVTLHGTSTDGRSTQLHFLHMQPLGPSFKQLKGGLYRRC
jgi:hypothetical protein